MRGVVGYVYKSKLKGRRSLCIAALFPQNDVYESLFAWIVGLIDEISTERIHIEEKMRGDLFIYLPTETMIHHTLLV